MLKSFGKDFLIYGFSSSLTKFIGLFLIPLYTRTFSVEEYGSMDIILTIFSFACIFTMMQLESAIARYYYSTKNEKKQNILISTALWSIVIVSVFMVVFLIVSSNVISMILFDNDKYANVILVAVLIIPAANMNSLFLIIIRFKRKPLHFLFFQGLQVFITVTLTIFLILEIKTGIIGVFYGMLVGFLISALSMLFYLKNKILYIINFPELKKMLRYSLPLMPAVAGGWVNSYMSRFVMLGYMSLLEIGIYAVALKIASIFQLFGAGFRMAWSPFFWDNYENNINHRELFVDLQQYISMIVLFFVIIITLFSKEIIILISTEDYLSSYSLVGILSFSLALSTIISPITAIGPSITKKTEYNSIIYFFSVTVNMISLFILVPLIGLFGVTYSLLLGSFTLMILGWYNSEKLYKVNFNIRAMIVNVTVTFLIVLINLYFDPDIIFRVVILIALSIILLFTNYKKVIRLYKLLTLKKND